MRGRMGWNVKMTNKIAAAAARRRHRHSDAEVMAKLQQSVVQRVVCGSYGDVAAQLGVSERTLHRWRRKYDGLSVDRVAYIKALKDEIALLRKAASELDSAES